MKAVYRSLAEAKDRFGPCALAIGNFDGVHLGHRTLIRQTREVAGSNGWKTAVLTFDPHPAVVVAPSERRVLSAHWKSGCAFWSKREPKKFWCFRSYRR